MAILTAEKRKKGTVMVEDMVMVENMVMVEDMDMATLTGMEVN